MAEDSHGVTGTAASPLEEQIAQWRQFLRRRQTIHGADIDELEDHLRGHVGVLTAAGLTGDEAFLVAVKRMGSISALSREFAREHSERLWKQLVTLPDDSPAEASARTRDAMMVFGFAFGAAAAVKVPSLFGVPIGSDGTESFYIRNASLFVLPFLCAYFIWKRAAGLKVGMALAAVFIAAAATINGYPFDIRGDTLPLAALHLPIALWLAAGVAYVGGSWFASPRRMDFVRFSGELFIYFVLIALGGGVFVAFTAMLFNAIGIDPEWFIGSWLVPCGAAGAVLVASWLVEAKQSVIENMAPVLTRLFTPLFTILLLAFLATMAWTGNPIDVGREVLIAFDLLLVLVVALVLYAVSARDPLAPPNLFDRLQLLLIVAALLVDLAALTAIGMRISEFGLTPNRVAALGENIILLAGLTVSAWLYLRFITGKDAFRALERWQVTYLPVYSLWAAIVVTTFPPLFGFS